MVIFDLEYLDVKGRAMLGLFYCENVANFIWQTQFYLGSESLLGIDFEHSY